MDKLLLIRREIEGEAADAEIENRVRCVSKTLFMLLTEAGATTAGFKSDSPNALLISAA